jgi:uncharacterized protein
MFAQFAAQFDPMYAVAGALVGVLVGMTGVGGGSLMTPLLVLMFGVSPHTAVGTDLLYAAATKVAGSAVHGWRETVEWRIVRRLATGSIPAALLTLLALTQVGKIGKDASAVILTVLGCMLILTAIATLFQKRIIAMAGHREEHGISRSYVPTVALGALLGVLVTISSVGAGAIGVTALLVLYPNLKVSRIIGTDIAHAVPLAMLGGAGHWFLGEVDFMLLLNLLVGSIPGVILGSLFSTRAPDHLLRPALAAVLMVSGVRLLL